MSLKHPLQWLCALHGVKGSQSRLKHFVAAET